MTATVRCGRCGAERPASASGACAKCLLQLGLDPPQSAKLERLGSYEILSRLGSGGMGEVYRARDSRLGREVAIKVLPDTLAGDPERIARFHREARVAASLNHPNIAAIYGFEEENDVHFLVMELVEGSTLAERLDTGALPVDEALAIAAQIAAGLESAHEKGVVHRDLKPSNVKITPGGKAKILDFGLAKAMTAEPSSPGPDPLLTITTHYTVPGMVLGTVPYMSPEQARGRPVDSRADIWSLGCVLYECLAGCKAFDGETPSDVVAKILEREPDWEALPARTPPRVRDLLERCLEKELRRRTRDSGDVRIDLERALEAREWTSSRISRATAGRRPRIRVWLPWALALFMTAVALISNRGAWWKSVRGDGAEIRRQPAVAMRVDVSDPEVPHRSITDFSTLAISPDGTTIVYVGEAKNKELASMSLYVRRADQIRARTLEVPAPSHMATDPFISADGKWLGFISGFEKRGIYKIPLAGGPPSMVVATAGNTKAATWAAGGIIFSPAAKAGLVFVSDTGGPLETLTVPDASKGEVSHRWPSELPDGRHVLFTIKKEGIMSFDEAEIALLDVERREWRTIIRGGSFARYVPPGHIVYAREGAIMAVRFDLDSGKVEGPPVTVVKGVTTEPGSGAAQFAVSQEAGTLVFVPGGPNVPRTEIVWVDRRGDVTPTGAPLQHYDGVTLSPDGTRVSATVWGATDAVYVYDFGRRALTRIGFEGNCSNAGWTLDGKILFTSDRGDGENRIFRADPDGSGPAEPLGPVFDGAWQSTTVRLKDGTGLLYVRDGELWFAHIEGDPRQERIAPSEAGNPSVSPDGRWLAYDSDVSGQKEVYVRPFPAGNGNWQVSVGGGAAPLWSPQGDEVLYQKPISDRTIWGSGRPDAPNSWMRSVKVVATSTSFSAGQPVDLFKVPGRLVLGGFHPDGTRVVGLRYNEPEFKADRIEAILNWSDQFGTRVPKGGR